MFVVGEWKVLKEDKNIMNELEIAYFGDLFTGEYPAHISEHGIDFWGHETGELKILERSAGKVLIREAGHSFFSGRGEQAYGHPRYYIGIVGLGKGHGRDVTECVIVFYSVEYTKQTQGIAKETAYDLYNNLK